jgi:hypothetical protein
MFAHFVLTTDQVSSVKGFWKKITLREWVSLIWASSKVIFRQTSKGDIPKTVVTNRTNLRGNFKLNSNLIQSHLRRHLRF